MGVCIPEEHGGAGADFLSYILVLEELSRADAGVGVTVAVHTSAVTLPILTFGTDEQRSRFVPPLARGEAIGAFALTEPEAGLGRRLAADRGDAGRGRLDDHGREAVDHERRASPGPCSLFARTDPETPGASGVSAFVLDGDQVRVTREEEKLGLNSSSTVDLAIEGAQVGRDRLLHEEGKGFAVAMATLDGGRIGIAAQALGIAQAAYDVAREYALERRQFGKRIADFQAIQWKLADMATEIDAARLLVYRAAWLKQEGRPHTEEGAKAKLFASEMARRQTAEAIQVLGGYGYTKEFPVERYYRDAKITEIYEGTSEIQRLVIARSILGLRERELARDEPAQARRAGPPDEDLHARRRRGRDEPRRRLARPEARSARRRVRRGRRAQLTARARARARDSTRAARAAGARSRTSSSTSAPICRCPTPGDDGCASPRPRSTSSSALCDRINEGLPELKSFVLPGGSEAAARLHVARAVCRRAELRRCSPRGEVDIDPLVPVYLNRLSDLLFILARASNAGGEEPLWRPGA